MKVYFLSPSSRRRRNAAFILIEMVLALAIIALLVGAGDMNRTGVLSSQEGAVKADITAITAALRLYSMKAGRLPTQEQGLRALVERPIQAPLPKAWAPQMNSVDGLMDPWDNMYQYRNPGLNGREFDVYSLGADRTHGTEDDIGNW